jgi:hypothetical protein
MRPFVYSFCSQWACRPPHPSPPPQRGEGIFLALNAFLAKLPPSSNTSPDFWVKLSKGRGDFRSEPQGKGGLLCQSQTFWRCVNTGAIYAQ